MSIETEDKSAKKTTTWKQQAAERVVHALNRADEIGGEVRDYIQERVITDPRYVAVRRRVAGLLGKKFVSHDEVVKKAVQVAEKKAAVASTAAVATTAKKNEASLGDPGIKAQIYGKKSCPWSGRAITLLEKHKVDYDWVDLDEPENEPKLLRLSAETKQNTVPYVYLRGQFIGGFNALSEVERLGQLEAALMSAEEKAAAPAHQRGVVIAARPNTDEVVPADADPTE